MLKRCLFVALLFSSHPAAFADYLSSTCGQNFVGKNDAAMMPIRRLYIATIDTNICRGRDMDCVRNSGKIERIDGDDETSMRVVVQGSKALYSGSRDQNKISGTEWMEFVVKQGKVRSGRMAVQIIEMAMPWERDTTKPANYIQHFTYQHYGECKHSTTSKVKPVEPIPPLPPRPAVAERMSDIQMSDLYQFLWIYHLCTEYSTEFVQNKELIYAATAKEFKQPDIRPLIDMMITGPQFKYLIRTSKIESERDGQRDPADMQHRCGHIMADIKRAANGPDPEFATPEKTFNRFKRALESGDRETVLLSLDPAYERDFRKWFDSMSTEEIKSMADMLAPIEIKASLDSEWYRATGVLDNGTEVGIGFRNVEGEWRVSGF